MVSGISFMCLKSGLCAQLEVASGEPQHSPLIDMNFPVTEPVHSTAMSVLFLYI